MAARLKNLVTRREEKVVGSLTMNRMLSCFMGAGFVYALTRAMQLGFLTVPVVIFSLGFFIWLTGEKGGVPRYMVFVFTWQARLMIAARRASPDSLFSRVIQRLGWDTQEVLIDGDVLFSKSSAAVANDMSGLEILDSDLMGSGGFEIVPDDELFIEI